MRHREHGLVIRADRRLAILQRDMRAGRRHREHGGHDEKRRIADLRHCQSHIFMPEGIFFISMLPPELSAPAGPCAPTPCTSSESFTLPAFSNSSVSGTLSPC